MPERLSPRSITRRFAITNHDCHSVTNHGCFLASNYEPLPDEEKAGEWSLYLIFSTGVCFSLIVFLLSRLSITGDMRYNGHTL